MSKQIACESLSFSRSGYITDFITFKLNPFLGDLQEEQFKKEFGKDGSTSVPLLEDDAKKVFVMVDADKSLGDFGKCFSRCWQHETELGAGNMRDSW